MEFHQPLRRKRLGSFKYLTGALVYEAHLLLLLIRHRHDAQREQFVNFRSVVEITRAFRGDLRIIIEDDRRREQTVAFSFFPDQRRPGAYVSTTSGGRAKRLRRIEQRDKLAPTYAENSVCRDQ